MMDVGEMCAMMVMTWSYSWLLMWHADNLGIMKVRCDTVCSRVTKLCCIAHILVLLLNH